MSQALSKLRVLCDAEALLQRREKQQDVLKNTVCEPHEDDGNKSKPCNDNGDLWTFHQKIAQEESSSKISESEGNDEFKHYLNRPLLDIKDDPIKFWEEQKTIYPILSRVYLQFLTILWSQPEAAYCLLDYQIFSF